MTFVKRNLYTAFLFFLLLTLISCNNIFNSTSGKNSDADDENKTFLSVKIGRIKAARTINPAVMDIDEALALFSDFSLSGVFTESTETADPTIFFSAIPSVAEVNETKVPVLPGHWQLTLSAKCNGILYTGSTNVEIKQDAENSIAFVLSPAESFGGFSISFDVSGTAVSNAKACLSILDSTEPGISLLMPDADGKIRYSKDITDPLYRMEKGTYLLSVEFYAYNDENPVLLNTWENYIAIQPGVMTTAEISMNFNELYSITYDYDGGELAEGFQIEKYSAHSAFELPVAKKTGYLFLGWYEDFGGSLSTSNTTEITKGTSGNKTFVAKYQSTSIYVSASGDDDTGDGSDANPVKSVNGVSTIIESFGTPDTEWVIYIDGILAVDTSQTIPATVTADYAKSILITGKNGPDGSGEPQDALDRGITATTNGSTNGNVLIINTEVPVTITSLKLMRGAAADGSALKITQGSTVKLGDGVRIIKNHYSSNAYGVVRNEGTLFMYGDAVIGDASASDYATNSSSPSNVNDGTNANYATSGGGIYNGSNSSTSTIVAKLYLGYSGYDSDGVTPVKEALTGGIYKNGGGGIYNSYNSFVYFDSGTIAWNAYSNGGGVYNEMGATFEMTGGSIINNNCKSSSDVAGGGLYNAKSSSKFIMSGGIINQNIVNCTNTASSSSHGYGGGVYNAGYMFMYGSAVIGNKAASSLATSSDYGNYAREGGGIYNDNNSASSKVGKLYIGYEPSSDGTSPVKAELTGGIYQNYADTLTSQTNGGGAISSANSVQIASGTIAYNATSRFGGAIYSSNSFEITGGTIRDNDASVSGGAIYMAANSSYILTLGGSFEIPYISGGNDIFLAGSSATYHASIQISDSLDGSFEAMLTPDFYAEGVQYISLATGSTANLAAEVQCFEVTPQVSGTAPDTVTTEWAFDSNGKLIQSPASAGIEISFTQVFAEGDIEVIADDTRIPGSVEYSTGTTSYLSYSWTFDGMQMSDSPGYSIDIAALSPGIHEIGLEVEDSAGNHYSWYGQYEKS